MLKVLKIFIILLLGSCLVISCSSDTDLCGSQPDNIEKVDLTIERLESDILNLTSATQLEAFILKEPVIAEMFLRINEYPDQEIFINELLARFSNPYLDSLRMEVEQSFEDISWLEKELEDAFSLLRHYYPDVRIPKVKTVATGFDYDLMVSDSLIVIGLDYYMGPEAKFRPMGTYNYILKRYDKKYIVPSIMLLYGISSEFNKHDESDQTILSDMISYGKAFYFTKRMLPCVSDSTLIWYSDQEFEGVKENNDIVWAHFLENNLLFEKSHMVKRKYIEERPKTYEIGNDCPPRVATWLGWEIVNKYMADKPGLSLTELMSQPDARKIFNESKYRPD